MNWKQHCDTFYETEIMEFVASVVECGCIN